jgi:hypothetical protein
MDGVNEMQDILERFNSFLSDRIVELSNEMSTTNTEYDSLVKLEIQYYRILQQHLPKDLQPIIFKLDENTSCIQSMIQEFMYLQGFRDGMRMKGWME